MSSIEAIATAVEQFTKKSAAEIEALKKDNQELTTEFKSLSSSFNELAQKQPQPFMGNRQGAADVLAKALSDDRVKAFQTDRGIKSASVSIQAPLGSLITKNLVVGDAASSSADLFNVQPQRDGRLGENPQRALTIIQALPRLPVGSNTLEYNRLNGYSNLAAIQAAEGSDLGQTAVPTTLVEAKIATLGHYAKMSEQVAADAPLLRQQVENLLRYGVLAKAAHEIIAGTGSVIEGLESLATGYTAATDRPYADAIGEAATELQIAGWQPDLVVMHPTLWQLIRADRSATEGLYVAGSWSMPAGNTIWGLRVVVDPSVSTYVPLVMDSSQCAILDRADARVELGRTGNDFTDAVVTLRAMIRIGLAVFSPSAIMAVTVP